MASIGTNASMTSVVIGVISGLITLIISVVTSSIIVGTKWGRLSSDVDHMKSDLAEIKGMFTMKLKE